LWGIFVFLAFCVIFELYLGLFLFVTNVMAHSKNRNLY